MYVHSHNFVYKEILSNKRKATLLLLTSSGREPSLRFSARSQPVEMLGATLKFNKAKGFRSLKAGSVAADY